VAWTASKPTSRCAIGAASSLTRASFTSGSLLVAEAFAAIATTKNFLGGGPAQKRADIHCVRSCQGY
jgi:hypothetical protein